MLYMALQKQEYLYGFTMRCSSRIEEGFVAADIDAEQCLHFEFACSILRHGLGLASHIVYN